MDGNEYSDAYSVSRVRLAQTLSAIRVSSKMTRDTIQHRLELAIANLQSSASASVVRRSPLATMSIADLEAMCGGGLSFSVSDFEAIAQAYDVHRLLIDPLVSHEAGHICVKHEIRDFIELSAFPNTSSYGYKCHYSYPKIIPHGTGNISIGCVRIGPGGCSDIHRHNGNELILVVDGSIVSHLLEPGLAMQLRKGDFVHFVAEQTHFVRNMSKTTEGVFLVLRLPRAEGPYVNGLATNVGKRDGGSQCKTDTLSSGPLKSRNKSKMIQDRAGLGRLLQKSCQMEFGKGRSHVSLRDLSNRSKGQFSRSQLNRIHQGQVSVSYEAAESLATLHGIDPVLVANYAFPAIDNCILVQRHPRWQDEKAIWSDWKQVPSMFLADGQASYWVPCRRLALDDSSVSLLSLGPGCSAPNGDEHCHCGQEIVVPLTGEVTLRYGGTSATVKRSQDHTFLQFTSDTAHRLVNTGDTRCLVVVFRLLSVNRSFRDVF